MLRRVLFLVLTTVALSACGGGDVTDTGATATEDATVRREPGLDVLLITVDTLRADSLGSYGNHQALTPWMDRLATEGVRFDRARAHNVVTLPTHASILSGLYPQEHGVRDNSGFRFPRDQATLATILRQEGYRTGAFISAFPLDSRFGLDLGFDVYEDSFVGTGRRPAFYEQERSGVETVNLAKNWIAEGGDRPWFCWVHLYEPHFPYEPPDSLENRFKSDPYLGDVAAADAAIGSLLESIVGNEPGGQTLVVLTSDHGEALGEHGEATHGIFAYEGTLRVPLILHQPRLFAPRVVENPVRHIDVLPTILDALAISGSKELPGRSLLAEAQGQASVTATATYFESLSPQLNRGWAPLYGIVEGDMKYIDLPVPELYDLRSDPGETTNLIGSEPERLAELKEKLALLRTMDRGLVPTREDAETIERLRSLGYLSGSPGEKPTYAESDDPKNLIDLDEAMRQVTALYVGGDLSAALEGARNLARVRPGMRMVLLELAHLEREAGNLEAAIETLREAYVLNPADNSTLALLGGYLTQAGRPEEAMRLTEPHSRLAEPDVDVLLVQALALARARQGSAAFEALDKARRIAPDNPMVPVHKGTLYLMSGAREQARRAFEEALALNPRMAPAHTALGMMAVEEGRFDIGVEHWREAVKADPRQASRLLALGTHLWSRGQTSAARPLLELLVSSASEGIDQEEISRVRTLLEESG